jgi:putative transposase
MNSLTLRPNSAFEWEGHHYRIVKLEKNGDVILERLPDLAISVVKKLKLLAEYKAERLVKRKPPSSSLTNPYATQFGRRLEELPEKLSKETKRRLCYLEGIFIDGIPVFTKRYLLPLIENTTKELNDPNPPSVITIYRWYISYKRTRDIRSQIPRYDRRGSKKLKQKGRILQLTTEAIEEAFQASPQAHVPEIHARLAKKITVENQKYLGKDKLETPSLSTMYRILQRTEIYEQVRLKEGEAAALRKFRIVKAVVRTCRILERVEVDHTPLDLFLVDEMTWLPLGRPILTVFIDHYSRMLLGYYLTFDSPSAAAVIGGLRHAILPKAVAEAAIPGLKIHHTWPCYGMPEVLVVDNGLEFHGIDLDAIALDLGLEIIYCPKRQPRYKGVVERFLKTVNYSFASQIPGASYAKYYLRGDYDPQKCALLTLAQFKQVFEKWVLDIYAQKIHRGIGTTPWAKWHESLADNEPALPADIKVLEQRIGKVEERSLRADGILLKGIRYNGEALAPILRAYGAGVKVRLVYNPEDLGEIQVWGPESNDPVSVQALDWEYANGLTLRQHECLQKILMEKGKSAEDRKALLESRVELSEGIASLMLSPKQTKRRRSGALRGFTSSQPEGSALAKVIAEKAKPKPVPKKGKVKAKTDTKLQSEPKQNGSLNPNKALHSSAGQQPLLSANPTVGSDNQNALPPLLPTFTLKKPFWE